MKYITLLLSISITISTFAQQINKTIYSQTPLSLTRTGSTGNKIYLLPEFYSITPKHSKDTMWKFECYDARDSIINIDTVSDINEVRYFSVFKSFTDSAHTYKDANGQKQLLPVSSIIQRYDRIAKDKWRSIDYSRNKYSELKEFQQNIVKRDTTIIWDPVTGKEQSYYYKYYKVVTLK
jgi:hypothetical protein